MEQVSVHLFEQVALLVIGALLGLGSAYVGSLFARSQSLLEAKRQAYAKVIMALREHRPDVPNGEDAKKKAILALTEASLLVSDYELLNNLEHAQFALQKGNWKDTYGLGAHAAMLQIRNAMKKELRTEVKNFPWKRNYFFLNLRNQLFPLRERG